MTPRIEVEIDELVLHGFAAGERHQLAAGLQAEFTEALAGWRPDRSRSVAEVDAGSFDLRPGTPATTAGGIVARRISSQLGQWDGLQQVAGSDRSGGRP